MTTIKELNTTEEANKMLSEIVDKVNKSWNAPVKLSGRWCCPKDKTMNLLRCGLVSDDDERFVWYLADNIFQVMMTCCIFRCTIIETESEICYELFDGNDFNEPVYRVELCA